MGYRTILFALAVFDHDLLGIFFIKYALTVGVAIFFPYQYVKYMQYFDSTISEVFGFMCFLFSWIMINSLLTYVIPLTGHFIVIMIGIIPIYMLVVNMRWRFLDELVLKSPEKMTTELEAIAQCYAIYHLTKTDTTPEQEIKLIGLINLHLKECQKPECPLTNPFDLYDPFTDKHVGNIPTSELHKNQVFLKHFCKYYFEASITNFGNYPSVRISYASFLFHSFKNVHAALSELNFAKKSKPNIMQSFEIYKFEQTMQAYMQSEAHKHKNLYFNLTRVLEFEQIFKECLTSMWQTCEAQLTFWGHMQQTSTLDFNVLDKDGEKIQKHASETEELWKKLCKINPAYPRAVTKYSIYLKEIRNNEQLSNELREQNDKTPFKKTLTNIAKNNDTLFDDKTVVLHVSGSKDALGKILQTNKGAFALFGFTANELNQNSVSKIMPPIIGKKHNELMDKYFKTGKSRIFNKERYLYGQHKDGHCFKIRLMVRPMPTLDAGFIQYVGLIIKVPDDYEYIITDMGGLISSMSAKLATAFGIEHRWIHQAGGLNVQMIAPDLIPSYHYKEDAEHEKRPKKFMESGGEELMLVMPDGLEKWIAEGLSDTSLKKRDRSSVDIGGTIARFNSLMNQRKRPKESEFTPEQLWNLDEYKNSNLKAKVKCQIQDMRFSGSKTKDLIKLRILKISGLKLKKDATQIAGKTELDISISNQEIDNRENDLLSEVSDNSHGSKSKESMMMSMMAKITQQGVGNNAKSSDGGSNKGSEYKKGGTNSSELEKFTNEKGSQADSVSDHNSPINADNAPQNQTDKNSSEALEEAKLKKRKTQSDAGHEEKWQNSLNRKKTSQFHKQITSRSKMSEKSELDQKDEIKSMQKQATSKEIVEVDEDEILDEGKCEDTNRYISNYKDPSSGNDLGKKSGINKDSKNSQSDTQKINENPGQKKVDLLGIEENVADGPEKPPPIKNSEPDVNDFDEENIMMMWVKKSGKTFREEDEVKKEEIKLKKNESLPNIKAQEEKVLNEKDAKKDLEKNKDTLALGSITLSIMAPTDQQKDLIEHPKELISKEEIKDPIDAKKENPFTDESMIKPSNDKNGSQMSKNNEQLIQSKSTDDLLKFAKLLAEVNPAPDIPEQHKENNEHKGSESPIESIPSNIDLRPVKEAKKEPMNLVITPIGSTPQDQQKPIEEIKKEETKKEENKNILEIPLEQAKKQKTSEITPAKQFVNAKKKMKITDNPNFDQDNQQIHKDAYEPTEHEMAVRQHFYVLQMKEKRGKEKDKIDDEEKNDQDEEDALKKEKEDIDEPYEEEKNLNDKDDEGSVGSTSTNSTIRATYSIRAAVDEKFVPKSIKNMNIMTIFMFALVLALAIAYYVYAISLYSSIQKNIMNIEYSEQRQTWLIDISLKLKTLLQIAAKSNPKNGVYDILNVTNSEIPSLLSTTYSQLKQSAINLKEAQTTLSLKTSDLSTEQLDRINPNNVPVYYLTTTIRMPSSYIYTISQMMLEIMVSAFKILGLPLAEIARDEFSVYVVCENSLNSILIALKKSTNEIVSQIESSKDSNMRLFLILLCVASGAAAISTIVLIPIIILVKKNKEKVLSLFLHLTKDDMRRYQIKCEKFKRSNKLVFFSRKTKKIER